MLGMPMHFKTLDYIAFRYSFIIDLPIGAKNPSARVEIFLLDNKDR